MKHLFRLHFILLFAFLFLQNCRNQSEENSDTVITEPQVKRLQIIGARIHDEKGSEIQLKGCNIEGIDEVEANDIKNNLKMNTVRLRIYFDASNMASGDNSIFSESYKNSIRNWIQILSKQGLWIILEMRTSDDISNTSALYDSNTAMFKSFINTWVDLAKEFKNTDYIAAYGILSEPSTNKAGFSDSKGMLIQFQKKVMDNISVIDSKTPFVIGPDWNYETLQYRYDDYYQPTYKNRVIYAVNFLSPKPWIQDGTSLTGDSNTYTYPQPEPTDGFSSLLEVKAGENYNPLHDLEKIFNARTKEISNYPKILSKGYISWYLQWPLQFGQKNDVPIFVDQFGASNNSLGQIAYETDLLDYFDSHKISWCRWSYNAGTKPRMMKYDTSVYDFYKKRLNKTP